MIEIFSVDFFMKFEPFLVITDGSWKFVYVKFEKSKVKHFQRTINHIDTTLTAHYIHHETRLYWRKFKNPKFWKFRKCDSFCQNVFSNHLFQSQRRQRHLIPSSLLTKETSKVNIAQTLFSIFYTQVPKFTFQVQSTKLLEFQVPKNLSNFHKILSLTQP